MLVNLLKTIKQRCIDYFNRLNTGARPVFRPPAELPEPARKKDRPAIHILLFIITFFTTTFAGASGGDTLPAIFVSGLPYSVTLLMILLCHEFGHYIASRRFGVDATLPYFIPFPSIVGTMGAVIKTRSPIPSRRALLYIGAMGPLSGFILSLAAVIIGIYLSDVRPLPAGGGDAMLPIFGDSLLFAMIVKMMHGTIPPGQDIFLSSYAWAGWIGFLITSLNLMPIGQLDGGHVMYAVLGNKQRLFGWTAFISLIVMSFLWEGWLLWVAFTLLFLMVAHPEVPEGEPLSTAEKIIGWSCMLILVLTFVPVPVELL